MVSDSWVFRWIVGAGAACACSNVALASEYRTIHLADGRQFVAEVLEAAPEGLTVATPQGKMLVLPESILSLESIDKSEFDAAKPLTALIVPFSSADSTLLDEANASQAMITKSLARFPGIALITDEQLEKSVGEAGAARLAACRFSVPCASSYGTRANADLVVLGQAAPKDGATEASIHLAIAYPQAPEAGGTVALSAGGTTVSAAQARNAIREALGLLPEEDSEMPVAAPVPTEETASSEEETVAAEEPVVTEEAAKPVKEPRAPREKTGEGWAWVPIPGFNSLIHHDVGGFYASWAVAVPVTAATVGIAGHTAMDTKEFAVVGLLSYYGVTVAVNRVFGARGANKKSATVGFAPSPDGGGTVMATIQK